MKKLLTVSKNGQLAAKISRTTLVLLLGVALTCLFWMATAPVAKARVMSPAEMIQAELPAPKTLITATKAQLLRALCPAIKKHPDSAAQIVRTAASAHKAWTKEIQRAAFQCLGHDDCAMLRAIVGNLQVDDPEDASALHDYFVEFAPNCAGGGGGEDEGNFTNPPSNINAPPGSVGSGAGQNLCLVCHNNSQIQIPCDQLNDYLKAHPGDTAGTCVVSSTTNK